MPAFYKKSYLTYSLIAVNVFVFLLETMLGGSENETLALHFGVMYTPYILGDGEWYRVFTSMFLHFGFEHLATNMFSLFVLGPYIELIFGRARYLLIYLFSGLCGNLLSLALEFSRITVLGGSFGLSAGASGAIFGLLGAIGFLALIPQFRRAFPIRNVLLGVVMSVAAGMSNPTINVTAHIGGLLGGFIMAAVLYALRRSGARR